MKNILGDLPKAKRQSLAHLYETADYKVLKDVMETLRLNQAKNCLDARTIEEVKFLQGQAHGLKMLHLNLKELHKNETKG